MIGWLSAAPVATTEPTDAQMLKQLGAAITKLEKATTTIDGAADRLAAATPPQKSRLRRAVEIGAGLLLADGVLTFLAGTVPLAGTALTLLQDAFTLTLGLGPVSALVDGLLFAGYTVNRIQKTGSLPPWLIATQHLVEGVQRLCDRLLPGHDQPPSPSVDPSPPPEPTDPTAPIAMATGRTAPPAVPRLQLASPRRRAPARLVDSDALQL